MKYLDCVFHETMRIYQYAVGIFFREGQYDHMLGDLLIKKGALMSINSIGIHYFEKIYD